MCFHVLHLWHLFIWGHVRQLLESSQWATFFLLIFRFNHTITGYDSTVLPVLTLSRKRSKIVRQKRYMLTPKSICFVFANVYYIIVPVYWSNHFQIIFIPNINNFIHSLIKYLKVYRPMNFYMGQKRPYVETGGSPHGLQRQIWTTGNTDHANPPTLI